MEWAEAQMGGWTCNSRSWLSRHRHQSGTAICGRLVWLFRRIDEDRSSQAENQAP